MEIMFVLLRKLESITVSMIVSKSSYFLRMFQRVENRNDFGYGYVSVTTEILIFY